MQQQANRVALVTGASRGIGRVTVKALAEAGYRVVATARSGALLDELQQEVEAAGGECLPVVADAADADDAARAVSTAADKFGRLDVLVNNAGIGILGPVVDTSIEDFDRQVASNLRSVFLHTRAAVPLMIAQGGGHLVNIASISGLKGFAGASSYVATKFAAVGFSRALDIELRPHNIKVTAICPAGVDTEWAIGTGLDRNEVAKIERLRPETIAESVLYAVSQPANARVTELVIYPMSEEGHQ